LSVNRAPSNNLDPFFGSDSKQRVMSEKERRRKEEEDKQLK
jgi:hypothetical protein